MIVKPLDIVLFCTYFILLFFSIFWLLVLFFSDDEKEKKTLARKPFFTTIVPAYNEERSIIETLTSLINLDYFREKMEIIVVNDGSTDNTKSLVEEFITNNPDREITLINQKNQGKGRAMNVALEVAKGEFFACLDADSIKEMLPYFEADQNVAAVCPTLKVKKPSNILQKVQWFEYIINMFYKFLNSKIDCIHVTPGPFSVYKKKDIDEIGGFDEDNLTEDLELSLNLQKHHKRIRQNNKVVVETSAPETWKSFYKQRNRWYKGGFYNTLKYRSMIFNKQYGDFGLLQFPAFFAMGWLVLVLMMIGIVKLVSNIYDFFINLYDINFDILHFIDFSGFWWFSIEYANILLMIFATTTLMVLLFSAINHHEEKLFKEKWILLPLYLVVYGLFLVFVWLGILIDMIFGKKQKW